MIRDGSRRPRLSLCFRVSRQRKSIYACTIRKSPASSPNAAERARAADGAVAFLKQLYQRPAAGGLIELETLTSEEYERRRRGYIQEGKGKPPAGVDAGVMCARFDSD